MLIVGAPELDQYPLGLGHKATLGGHYFASLNLTLPRLESDQISRAMQGQIVASIGPALPQHADPRPPSASPCGIPLCLLESGSELSASSSPVGNGILALSPGTSG